MDMTIAHLQESTSGLAHAADGIAPAPFKLKGQAYKSRRHRIELTRSVVQLLTLAVIVWIGVEFVLWLNSVTTGEPVVARPQGVEGFLPISALISLRYWWITGTISKIHPAGLTLLLLILTSALLLKKSFCSWLCPVGTISESLSSVGRKIFRRKLKLPRWLDYPLRSIKYLLLFFFVWAVFVQMTPKAIELFLGSPYNKVADVKMLMFFSDISPFSLKVLIGLVGLSLVIPFFWCRYLCPYGALLGFLSMWSPLKVTRKVASCIDCELCAKACPSHIAVDKVNRVHSDECFGCLSCVAACPVPDALNVETPKFWPRRISPLVYAAAVVVLFFGGIGVARITGHWQNNISDSEYQRRIGEIHSSKYHHAQGQVPAYGPKD
jgi:polyferredoxin